MSQPGEIYIRKEGSFPSSLMVIIPIISTGNHGASQRQEGGVRQEGYIEEYGFLGTLYHFYTDIFL